jgi:hypothetical protein
MDIVELHNCVRKSLPCTPGGSGAAQTGKDDFRSAVTRFIKVAADVKEQIGELSPTNSIKAPDVQDKTR